VLVARRMCSPRALARSRSNSCLAQDIERFVERMGPVHTDQELALRELRVRVRNEKRKELVR
jgi:hypothetical protein